MTEHSKIADEFQKAGKDSFEAVARSYGEDGARTLEQLVGAKSVEQAIEVQSQYVKTAYEAHVAEMTKLGEMYTSLVQSAFKPLAR
jgi:hypothetical protein